MLSALDLRSVSEASQTASPTREPDPVDVATTPSPACEIVASASRTGSAVMIMTAGTSGSAER